MSVGRTVAIVCAAAAACFAGPPDTVSVRAKTDGGMSGPAAEIRIDPDGTSRVVTTRRWEREATQISLELRLTDAELDDLRTRIAGSAFFDDPDAQHPRHSHAASWDVTIVLGAREKRRERVCDEPKFRPVEEFLHRFVAQAQAVDAARRGGAVSLAESLERPDERARLLRPDALVPELLPALVRAAIDAAKPYGASEAAKHLLRLATAAEFPGLFTDILAKLSGDRRDAALSVWAHDVAEPERAAQRAAMVPVAVAEVRASWKEWENLSHGRQGTLRALLALAVGERDAEALALAEEMMRSLSTLDRPFWGPGIVELGPDAVPIVVRLLADPAPEARYAASDLTGGLIDAAKSAKPRYVSLSDEARAVLAERLRAEVMPLVAERSRDPAEAVRVRESCFRTIAAWEGRDLAAERRARDAEAARLRAEERARQDAKSKADREAWEAEYRKAVEASGGPVPRGDLAISGRLVAEDGSGLAGFMVVSQREDGPAEYRWRYHGGSETAADGSFRIEHLVAGDFRLVAVRGSSERWWQFAGNSSTKDGVAAGTSDVVLRFAGTMIRGRLLDAAGRPIAGQPISFERRDAPNVRMDGQLAPLDGVVTDSDGRFAIVQMLPGVYDLATSRHPFLSGVKGVRTGPDEITISVLLGGEISGRVVDETGAPLAGACASARVEGRPFVAMSAETQRDGSFRIVGLDPSLRYVVGVGFAAPTCGLAADRTVESVSAGTTGLDFRIDTGPRLAVCVKFGSRGTSNSKCVRLVRDDRPDERVPGLDATKIEERYEDRGTWHVLWRAAPEGTWRVLAHVVDLDEQGERITRWIVLGTATTGEPEKTFDVPK